MRKTLLAILMLSVAMVATAQFDDHSDIFYNGSNNSNTTNNIYNGKGGMLGGIFSTEVKGQVFEEISVIAAKAPSAEGLGSTTTVALRTDPGTDPTKPKIPVGGSVAIFTVLGAAYFGLRRRK